MSDERAPHVRQDDIAIAKLAVQFENFTDRYDRDLTETKEWRVSYEKVQKEHTELLAEIAPNYRRGMWVIGLIIVGSVGALIKFISSHFSWN